jgi:hypothetical protein
MGRIVTDFHRHGLSTEDVVIRGRFWAFTIDFEAFYPNDIDIWIKAMDHWAKITSLEEWKSCIFLAIEDVVRLESERPREYARFLEAARRMSSGGATFYPHNHGIFDESTGLLVEYRPELVPNYPKRASMFFDVVHRHGRDIREWIGYIGSRFDDFIIAAELPRPARLAFRAGGWDHGVTESDVRAFVDGLTSAGFAWDSSASSGVFGTRTWRIGAPFGKNVFGLAPNLIEAAPCWSADALGRLHQPRTAKTLIGLAQQADLWRRHPGIFVTVFHFNNLVVGDGTAKNVIRRIETLFSKLRLIQGFLGIPTADFDDIVATRSFGS